jgi:hypothetical protein
MLATVLSPGREGKREHLRVGSSEQGNFAAFLEGGRKQQI